MDDYMFSFYVDGCKTVQEAMSYLEIFSYSDPKYNVCEEHHLSLEDFDNFLHRRGTFKQTAIPADVKLLGGCRMILQQNALHPDTFAPSVISLKRDQYRAMVETLRLPYRGIETTSCVGPFFWSALDTNEENPHLQIIYRKSDVRKKGKTRGWEMMLSHELSTGITTGFCKGTPSAGIKDRIKHLKACIEQIGHPLLFPVIFISHDLSATTDVKQRDARDWVRRLEHAISMRTEIEENEGYVSKDGQMDLDAINRDLVECHAQVLWKRPTAYLQLLDSFEAAMEIFDHGIPDNRKTKMMRHLHASLLSRMEFYRKKLQGIDSYAHTTLQRLDIQRSALYNIIAQKDTKLNFVMAGEQRKLAHAAKRDSASMKALSLLGAIFLPGAYLASVFSMTFFNFQDEIPENTSVAPSFWIYWAVTIPTTVLIVGFWWFWDRTRERQFEVEDSRLEKGIDEMEMDIMRSMRNRTMSKVSTWDKGST